MVVSALLCTVLSWRPTRPLALATKEQTSRAAELRLCALSRPEAAATVLRQDAHDLQRAAPAFAGVGSARATSRCALITCSAADGGGSWSAHSTEAGVTYYFNAADGSSSWELPPGVQLVAPPAAPPTPPPTPPPSPPPSYGAETPMPGREDEYAAYQAQGGAGGAGPAASSIPIDADRAARSQGIANNFYDG